MIKLVVKGRSESRIQLNFDTLVSGVKITAWGKPKYGETVEKLPRER